jgi:hypothetical protein
MGYFTNFDFLEPDARVKADASDDRGEIQSGQTAFAHEFTSIYVVRSSRRCSGQIGGYLAIQAGLKDGDHGNNYK